jgi:hypothetical protein
MWIAVCLFIVVLAVIISLIDKWQNRWSPAARERALVLAGEIEAENVEMATLVEQITAAPVTSLVPMDIPSLTLQKGEQCYGQIYCAWNEYRTRMRAVAYVGARGTGKSLSPFVGTLTFEPLNVRLHLRHPEAPNQRRRPSEQ